MAASKQILRVSSVDDSGVPVTGTDAYYSDSIELDGQAASWHMEWTETSASLTGTWSLWYSNKPNPDTSDDDDWVQDTAFPGPTVSGTGSGFVAVSPSTAVRARLKYTNATGEGTIKAWAAVARGRS